MPNKFKRVDKADDNAVTVNVYKGDNGVCADVAGPMKAGRSISKEIGGQDGSWPVPHALNQAMDLARKYGIPIVVRDEENLWQKEWGELT